MPLPVKEKCFCTPLVKKFIRMDPKGKTISRAKCNSTSLQKLRKLLTFRFQYIVQKFKCNFKSFLIPFCGFRLANACAQEENSHINSFPSTDPINHSIYSISPFSKHKNIYIIHTSICFRSNPGYKFIQFEH